VVLVVVEVEPPPSGAVAPPVGAAASAAGAHNASAASASASWEIFRRGEVIETMPAGAPQIIWNTPESVTSRCDAAVRPVNGAGAVDLKSLQAWLKHSSHALRGCSSAGATFGRAAVPTAQAWWAASPSS